MYKLVLASFLIFISSAISCASSYSNSLTIGNEVVFCLQYQKDGQVDSGSYMFKIKVDEFSAVKVSNTKDVLKQFNKVNAIVLFQNQIQTTSKSMKISDSSIEGGIYRDILSIVINIENGTFTKITLDNEDCSVCNHGDGTQACSGNTDSQCYSKAKNFAGEDPKFFVSWVGTDSSGNHLLSHTKRLSRFSQYSVGSIYQSAKGLVIG